jgi:3'-phosphoadenosine 5'-phosphosulfate sulfotransferase (PAPS reductase)/FAD synthetase
MKTKDIIQVSFSGGRSSAMMAKIMLDNYDRDSLLFTFANTGKEMPETLDFVQECNERWNLDMVWIEYDIEDKFKVVTYETASRQGEPFAALIEKKGYPPNRVARFCTADLKVRPMKAYIMSLGCEYWDCAIGIRADEPRRYHKLKAAQGKDRWDYIFPLYDLRIDHAAVKAFWASQGFDLAIPSEHGNCDFCFLKGMKKKIAQAHQMPHLLDWWIRQELKVGARFHKDFDYATIKSLALNPTLFDEPEIGCFCGD